MIKHFELDTNGFCYEVLLITIAGKAGEVSTVAGVIRICCIGLDPTSSEDGRAECATSLVL